jgi:hypothetical protein
MLYMSISPYKGPRPSMMVRTASDKFKIQSSNVTRDLLCIKSALLIAKLLITTFSLWNVMAMRAFSRMLK